MSLASNGALSLLIGCVYDVELRVCRKMARLGLSSKIMHNSQPVPTPKAALGARARGAWLRFHVRPNTFGNALGNSLGQSMASDESSNYPSRNRANMPEQPMVSLPGESVQLDDYSAIQQYEIPAIAGGDNRALLNSDKASYNHGDFNKRDVTQAGDSIASLFAINYGRAGSARELIQFANYNGLNNAHDVSMNREIISPSLEVLARQGVSRDQASTYLTRDAQYQQMFAQQRATQAAASMPHAPISAYSYSLGGSDGGINRNDVLFQDGDNWQPRPIQNPYMIDRLSGRIVPADTHIVQPYAPPAVNSNFFGMVKGGIDQWSASSAAWGARQNTIFGSYVHWNSSAFGALNDVLMPGSLNESAAMFAGGAVAGKVMPAFMKYANTLPTLGREVVFGQAGVTLGENLAVMEARAGANSGTISTSAADLRAIAAGAAELNSKQAAVLAELEGFGSRTVIPKKGFGQNDLAALSAATGDEFAMFSTGGRRLIIRGDATGVPIGTADGSAQALAAQGWRWSSHVHPDGSLMSSIGDRIVLSVFPNVRSTVLDPFGGRGLFNSNGDLISSGWLPH